MTLNTRRIIVNNQVRFVVVIDGVAEKGIGYGSEVLAFERIDVLWSRRPQSEKTMETLYVGSD